MIRKLNTQALRTASEDVKWLTLVSKVNQIIAALNVGVVHENKVQADRTVDGVYDSLPLSVVAEMIEEETTAAEAELGLKTEV